MGTMFLEWLGYMFRNWNVLDSNQSLEEDLHLEHSEMKPYQAEFDRYKVGRMNSILRMVRVHIAWLEVCGFCINPCRKIYPEG